MNKELEALSRIEDCLYEDPYADRNDVSYENDIATIKQALLKVQKEEKENAEYKQLEKQIGHPLKVVVHLVMNKPFYYKDENGVLHQISSYDLINKSLIFYLNWEDINLYEDIEIPLSDYKKTWWLKEDKSE